MLIRLLYRKRSLWESGVYVTRAIAARTARDA